MDFRSTKNGLTKSIRRFRDKPAVSTIGRFRGAIDPKFSDWIGNHLRFLEARLFKPVALDFNRPTNRFGQVRLPQPRGTRPHFVFSPKIQLMSRLTPMNNVFSEDNTSNFQSLSLVAAQASAARECLSSRLAWINNVFFENNISNFQLSSRLTPINKVFFENDTSRFPSVVQSVAAQPQRVGRQFGASILRNRERLFGALAGILQTRRVSETAQGRLAPLLITISSAVQRWRQFLASSLTYTSLWGSQSEKIRDAGRVVPGRTVAGLAGTMLSLRNVLKTMSADSVVASRQSFLAQLNLSEFRLRLASPERSFTNVVQKLVASKAAGPEATARQIQYFGLSPDLRYATSDSSQLQGVVNALRDFRPSQSEMKASSPQLPSIAQLTSQVRQELEREIRIERERRGL